MSAALGPEVARAIGEALRGVRHGSVEIVVHEGRVVRLVRRESVRLDGDPPTGASGRESEEIHRQRPSERSRPAFEDRGSR